jgi:hypothetical protein
VKSVFRGCAVQWFIDEVGEPCGMKRVSVDGPLCHVADFQVLSQSNSQRTRASFVGSHQQSFSYKFDMIENGQAQLLDLTPVKLPLQRAQVI